MSESRHAPRAALAPGALIAVVGGGTMGSGVAQVAASAGFQVIVQDIAPEVLNRSRRRIDDDLARRVERGRTDAALAGAVRARLSWTETLDDLRAADVIIEAVPEDLRLKQDLFRRLDALCAQAVILASNTSSLSISAIAAATRRPDRVVGMHFFNPAPVMALVEVIRGVRTSEETADATIALARILGKTPVQVREAPGFVVNRVARPFSTEAVRILAEGGAPVQTIDRVMREAGGYRMGPLELIDLIGLDVNLAVSNAIYEAFFYDPRYQPHPLQQRMVDAGLLGRKSGRGFYDYSSGASRPTPLGGLTSDVLLPTPVVLESGEGVAANAAWDAHGPVVVFGEPHLADDLVHTLRAAGIVARRASAAIEARDAVVAIDAGLVPREDRASAVAALDAHLAPDALLLVSTLTTSVTEAARHARHPDRVVGFATLPPLSERSLIEIQAGLRTVRDAAVRAAGFWRRAGKAVAHTADGVAGVFPRIQAMLCHEAIVALAAGIASAEEIDTAMRLGVNYPQGPIERAERVGLGVILAVVQALQVEHGDPRYRPVPLLRRWVAAGGRQHA
ncbi:MAG: 3-hydroxyacyl-CoA dehydrogenase NAD-binding domain-containing protein [Armatimonadota bacterium]|nr:3-hydroxyacyl-CoA dehydrogenase NAD-binding domain-containing protein [Armatimonadota bacterium]